MYGEKLKELRESNDLKQTELCKLLDIGNNGYWNYETEYQIIPIKYLNTLCNYFNVSLDYIFSFTNTKQYENCNKDINITLIGERLKEFRKENKISQRALAEILNIGNGTIADYERGRYLIATPFLYTICKKYKISADYLLGKVDSPKTF